jgi:hypothetical protein
VIGRELQSDEVPSELAWLYRALVPHAHGVQHDADQSGVPRGAHQKSDGRADRGMARCCKRYFAGRNRDERAFLFLGAMA